MRSSGSSSQSYTFVAEFAAKRAAQLERAKALREERKKTSGENQLDRPPSGSPMTYARSYRDDESKDTSRRNAELNDDNDPPMGNTQGSEVPAIRYKAAPPRNVNGVPSEVMVTEEDFRRAVRQGVITPDQARQLWSVLSDPSSNSRLESFKRSQPTVVSYDPARYEVNDGMSASSSNPILNRDTRRPPAKNTKSEWNSDTSFEPLSEDTQAPTPSLVGSRKVAGATFTVRQKPAWNDNNVQEQESTAPQVQNRSTKTSGSSVNNYSQRANSGLATDPQTSGGDVTIRQRAVPKVAPKQAVADRSRGNTRPGVQEVPQAPSQSEEVDQEELEEFLRLKEEQARQFEEALDEANDGSVLVPCNLCGRTFRETIIARHENACAKLKKKRKTFDMTKARLEGIDGAEDILRQNKRAAKAAPPPPDKPIGKLPKWKLQHQQFQAVLKMNKGGADALSGPPIPMPEELDDRVPCPHCGRKFATETAARHIPKCMTTINKPKSLARPIRR